MTVTRPSFALILRSVDKNRRSSALCSGFWRLPDGVGKSSRVRCFVGNRDGRNSQTISVRRKRFKGVMVCNRDAAARAYAKRRTNVRSLVSFLRSVDVRVRLGFSVTRIREHRNVLTRLRQHKHDINDYCERDCFHLSALFRMSCKSVGTGIGLKNQTFEPPVLPRG